jgi:hypothetical protein
VSITDPLRPWGSILIAKTIPVAETREFPALHDASSFAKGLISAAVDGFPMERVI